MRREFEAAPFLVCTRSSCEERSAGVELEPPRGEERGSGLRDRRGVRPRRGLLAASASTARAVERLDATCSPRPCPPEVAGVRFSGSGTPGSSGLAGGRQDREDMNDNGSSTVVPSKREGGDPADDRLCQGRCKGLFAGDARDGVIVPLAPLRVVVPKNDHCGATRKSATMRKADVDNKNMMIDRGILFRGYLDIVEILLL